MIRKIKEEDIQEISKIHKRAFDESHFTSHLSTRLLMKFYRKLIEFNSFTFLFEDDDSKNIAGFIIAGDKTQAAIDNFTRENFAEIFKIFLFKPYLLKPKLKAAFTKLIKGKAFSAQSSLRLLSIAVAPEFQNKKIGKQLILFLETELKKNNIYQYGLSVKNDNEKAIKFYNRNGYLIEKEIDDGIYYFKKL